MFQRKFWPPLGRSVRAFLNHAVVRITRTGNDGALRGRLARNIRRGIDRYRVGRVVSTGHEIILMVLPGGVSRPDEFVAKTQSSVSRGRSLPGVLGVAFVLEEVEVAEGEDVRLADGGVIAQKRIGDARVAVVRVLIAGAEIQVGILGPGSFLSIFVQIGKQTELDDVVAQESWLRHPSQRRCCR